VGSVARAARDASPSMWRSKFFEYFQNEFSWSESSAHEKLLIGHVSVAEVEREKFFLLHCSPQRQTSGTAKSLAVKKSDSCGRIS
jgi:hypothetical protein